MIHPNDIEPIAKIAYGLFLKSNPSNPAWDGVSATAKIEWRDRILAADRLRKKTVADNPLDDYALQAIRQFEEPAAVPTTAPLKPKKETK